MLDESLRTRLEALNRGPIPAPIVRRRIECEGNSSGLNSSKPATSQAKPLPHLSESPRRASSPTAFTPGLLHSGDVVETAHGPHLRIRLSLENLWPSGTKLITARHDFLRSQLTAGQDAIEPSLVLTPDFASLVGALPDRAIGLDLETCGLAGSALFLIGLLRQIDGQLTIELLLARNYAEESAVLATLWHTI